MISIYEASSGLEAHMVANLLEQAGIVVHIDGEYLQGGMGILPAMDMVRVLVNEADMDRARKVIDDWDKMQAQSGE